VNEKSRSPIIKTIKNTLVALGAVGFTLKFKLSLHPHQGSALPALYS
jgi:hypothetical protein